MLGFLVGFLYKWRMALHLYGMFSLLGVSLCKEIPLGFLMCLVLRFRPTLVEDISSLVIYGYGLWTVLDGVDGVKIPHNKGRHCSFYKSQLDSRTFGMSGSTGLWTYYHSKLWFGVL